MKKIWLLLHNLAIVALLIVGLTLFINVHIRSFSTPYIYTEESKIPDAEVALILGAAVYQSGMLTPVLEDRAETALDLYRAGKVSKILVSGDNSDMSHNEVVPVSKYLIAEGVDEDDIFLDYAGFDTYDSMYRARDVFEVDSVIIITQYFHLSRSIYIARKLGLEAYGYSADRRQYLMKNKFREYFATIKAFFDVQLDSKPKFLGETVPVSSEVGNVPRAEVGSTTATTTVSGGETSRTLEQ